MKFFLAAKTILTPAGRSEISEIAFMDEEETEYEVENIFDVFNILENCPDAEIYVHDLCRIGANIISALFTAGYKDAWDKPIRTKTFKTVINGKGLWYSIKIKFKSGALVNIIDSSKILPFAVETLSSDFLENSIDYTGTASNECSIIRAALVMFWGEGHEGNTIGSCCMRDYKKDCFAYDMMFPDLYEKRLPASFGENNEGDYIRHAYIGGLCFVNPEYEGKIVGEGASIDCNSLYPSVMHSSSENVFPFGTGRPFEKELPFDAWDNNRYFFVRINVRFELKKDSAVPCVAIRNSWLYRNQWATMTDYVDKAGIRHKSLIIDGEKRTIRASLTLTKTDYELLHKYYNVIEEEIIDGLIFRASAGMFDSYIDNYYKQKQTATGARRQIAKLFLNNLAGKFATNPHKESKILIENTHGVLEGRLRETTGKGGYIAIGAAITSYGRKMTVETINKFGRERFLYTDTDSVHFIGKDIPDGVEIDETKLGAWKIENKFNCARFLRQKAYIELTDDGSVNIAAAGLSDFGKNIFIEKMKNGIYSIKDFNFGLCLPNGCRIKRVQGGAIEEPDFFTIQQN